MEALFGLPALVLMALLGINSVKVTSGGQSRLVERLGKYDRQLQPGLSLVLPVLEKVVSHESLKERVLDIPPQQCITCDNVAIEVDAVVYWQLLEHARAYYAVDNLQAAMVNLVLTQIRAEMGKLDLDQTFTTRQEVNEALLKELDQATDPWGVKVTRVELRDIQPSRGVQQAMEQQMTAEREKRAVILRSEGERESQLNAARGRAEALVLDARPSRRHCCWRPRPKPSSRPCSPRPGPTPPPGWPRQSRPTRKPLRRCGCCWPATGWPWASRWPMPPAAAC